MNLWYAAYREDNLIYWLCQKELFLVISFIVTYLSKDSSNSVQLQQHASMWFRSSLRSKYSQQHNGSGSSLSYIEVITNSQASYRFFSIIRSEKNYTGTWKFDKHTHAHSSTVLCFVKDLLNYVLLLMYKGNMLFKFDIWVLYASAIGVATCVAAIYIYAFAINT